MPTPKILKSYRFLTPDDLREAEKALWCDIPSSILIIGERASGKTRLARDIAESNGIESRCFLTPRDQKSMECGFVSTNCVILDNLRDIPNGAWPFSHGTALARMFPQRKLGTNKIRWVEWSGLLIVTTSELAALDDLEPGDFDLVIGLGRPSSRCRRKYIPAA